MNLLAIPQLLAGGYGIIIRIVLVAVLALGIWAWGATWGYQHEEAKLDVFHAQVDLIAQQAIKRNAEVKAEQDKVTKELKEAHAKDKADRAAAAPRVRFVFKPARECPVPAPANGAGGHDGAPSQPEVAGRPEDVVVSQEFVLDCAEDAKRVNRWRKFSTKNKFPVE